MSGQLNVQLGDAPTVETVGEQSCPAAARLTGVVVHWRDEQGVADLAMRWPVDPRFPLLVVDNSSRALAAALAAAVDRLGAQLRVLTPPRNLGFGGGANLGMSATESPLVLILNPDALPVAGALETMLAGFDRWPDAVGIVPKLCGRDGAAQHRWQLRPLPKPWQLLLQGLFLPGVRGPVAEPPPGSLVAQPAAAALALRREPILALGGFDEGYWPAWFEDVDLARRLADAGLVMRYQPAAVVEHGLGGSVATLGYAAFLAAYYRNLLRYLARHHGPRWAFAGRLAVACGMGLRLLALPLRRPRRATSRSEAAQALVAVGWAALRGVSGIDPSAEPAAEPTAERTASASRDSRS